jgi:ATP-binding cassette subfamily B protein
MDMSPMPELSLKNRLSTALRLRRAWRLVWTAAPGWTLLNLGLVVFQGLLPLASLVLLKQIVDTLGDVIAAGNGASFTPVALWIGLAGLVALLSALCNSLGGLASEAQALAVADHVSDVIHSQSIAVDLGYYEDSSFHDTLHHAQQEAPFRPARIVNGLKQTLQSGLVLIGLIALLFTFHWAVGLALLLAAVPSATVRLVYARKLFSFEQTRAEAERQAWYYHWLMTASEYAREIRLFGVGEIFAGRFRELRSTLRDGRLKISRQRTRGEMIAQGLATLILYATLAGMGYYTVQGVLTLGLMVMYFQGYQRALTSLQSVLQGLAWLYEDNLFLQHFYAFLDLPSVVEQSSGASTVPDVIGAGLVCKDLHFTFPSRSEPVLRGVDLEIGAGEVVALVGANGAGKTTLAKLICRLYDPQQGFVSWAGTPLTDYTPRAWRRQISVVSQDFTHFDMTIGENIWMGDIDKAPRHEELSQAAKMAGVDTLLEKFPQGLDTMLGTEFSAGQELSVGEWQRMALARAWFRDARLLILDEPSSALDPLAEAELISSFRAALDKRSALVISHRLSTARMADRIYVLDQGRIAESGSHSDLIARGGLYHRLFTAQAKRYGETS